jgi:hypothetical protein
MLPVDVDVDFELDVVPLLVPELLTVPVFPVAPVVPDFVVVEDDLLVVKVPDPLDVVGALVVDRLENVLGWYDFVT